MCVCVCVYEYALSIIDSPLPLPPLLRSLPDRFSLSLSLLFGPRSSV